MTTVDHSWPQLTTVDHCWPQLTTPTICSWCYIAWVPNVHCCLKLATEQITNYWDQSLLLFDELATEANRGLIWIHDANFDAKVGARLTKVDKGADKMGSVPLLKIENWSFQVIWQIIDMNLPFFCFSSWSDKIWYAGLHLEQGHHATQCMQEKSFWRARSCQSWVLKKGAFQDSW